MLSFVPEASNQNGTNRQLKVLASGTSPGTGWNLSGLNFHF